MSVVATRLIDTIGQDLGGLRGNAYWNERPVLSYTTRTYAATAEQRSWFKHFVGVDQAPTDELAGGARIKDVESGGAFNSNVENLLNAGHEFVAYTFEANLTALRAFAGRSKHPGNVKYFLADWNFSEAQALQYLADHADVVAVQWCSPTTNGRFTVPGTGKTVAELNVDLSVGRQDYWLPAAPAPAHGASGKFRAVTEENVSTGQWTVAGIKGVDVVLSTSPRVDYAVLEQDLQHGTHKIRGLSRELGAKLIEHGG